MYHADMKVKLVLIVLAVQQDRSPIVWHCNSYRDVRMLD